MGLNLGEKTCLGYVIILRVYIGSYLLYQGIRKYLRDFPHGGWIERQIGKLNEVELFPWYKDFLSNVVTPNQELFGYLVMYGEILVGICLIIGLLTRFSAGVGIFMLANYVLGPGWARGASTYGQTQRKSAKPAIAVRRCLHLWTDTNLLDCHDRSVPHQSRPHPGCGRVLVQEKVKGDDPEPNRMGHTRSNGQLSETL